MKRIEISGHTVYAWEFITICAARRFADHADPPMAVILGDAPEFWAVRLADAERLAQAGYEYDARYVCEARHA